MAAIRSYRDLTVWQRSIQLIEAVYSVTKLFPEDERFGLITQLRRCAVSIPSNIAEGYHRSTRREYRHYVQQAYGSCAELETQLIIARRLEFAPGESIEMTVGIAQEVSKMLNVLAKRLK